MTDPIKIMDEIEKDERNLYQCIAGFGIENHAGWQAIRKAIEAQADRIAHQDQKHAECAENLVKAREDLKRLSEYDERLTNVMPAEAYADRIEQEAKEGGDE